MNYKIDNVVVIGSGTMGASIAAHFANAGVRVTLLDIVPNELTEKEKKQGLSLKDKAVRNRIVNEGYGRAVKAKPANFFSKAQHDLIALGNLDDDFDVIANADWVIEAVIEKMDIKQALMARIDKTRKDDSIISTNTSGLPVGVMAEGLSEGFRQHFLGTHFFNPPRYLKLLEIIPTEDTLPEVVDYISKFSEMRLGKGIVICKDTPNFIANRILFVPGSFATKYVIDNDITVPEADLILGRAMGRPKTGLFRLYDLVGIDTANNVRNNLGGLLPADDEVAQNLLKSNDGEGMLDTMVENGWLGNKTNVGFYKTVKNNGKKEFWSLNLKTMEHEAPGEPPKFESVDRAKEVSDIGERIKMMLAGEDKAADMARAVTFTWLSYTCDRIPEVADLPSSIDDATRWGYNYDLGPFEIWDALGVEESSKIMREQGYEISEWVDEMLANGNKTFYQYEGKTKVAVYNPATKNYEALADSPHQVNLQTLKEKDKEVAKNDGASLIDMGDGIVALEFHTKLNTLDADIMEMAQKGFEYLETDFDGMVIGNDAVNFSAGANIFFVVMQAQNEAWGEIEEAIRALQNFNQRIRYSSKPIVAAPAGLTLGGGIEISMHTSRIVAAAELYTGLVEVGVGLIPAGGGTKEMMRRVLNPPMRTNNAEPLAFMEQLFTQIGTAQVATSAVEARQMGMLGDADRIIMHRDHLLAEAKREARHLADSGYVPPAPEKIYAAGRDVLSTLRVGLYMFKEGNYISEYDGVVGEKLINVLTGGDLSKPQWVDEQYILDLECEAFLSLCGEKKTQERMWHTLNTGKPLRN